MDEARALLRALVDQFERRGWRDDGTVALNIALRLTADSSSSGLRQAAGAVPRAFLENNDAKRTELRDAIASAVASGGSSKRRVRRALVSVLFTDIVGSTESLERVGDAEWRRTLDLHDEISRRVTADYGGTVIQHTGDGVLATFDTATDAVEVASRLVRELKEAGVSIRAGVHAGEVEIRDSGNIAGTVVHAAQRVMGKAGRNEVYVSDAAREMLAGSDFKFEDVGEHDLKGYRRPRRLFRLK